MKRFSRHIAPWSFVALLLTSLVTGCYRKPLYLAQRGTLDVDVSVYDIQLDLLWGIDWKAEWQYLWDESLYGPIGYTQPSGVRANVYAINDLEERTRYTTRNLPKGGGRVSLTTKATYDMMFYNNDTEYILFSSDDNTTYFYATTRGNTKAAYTRSYDHYNQPDQLFGTFIEDLYVSEDPEDYTLEIDEEGNYIYVYKISASLTPLTFIYLYQVMLLNNEDEVGQRITGADGITASALSGGVDLFTRITDSTQLVSITQEDIKPMQEDRTLRLPDGTETVGDIFAARMMTWGLPGINPLEELKVRRPIEPQDSIYMGIGLRLRNGNIYPVQYNVTEQMKQRPAGGVITLVIDAAEIPDSIIGEKPKPGGGFDASVKNWENEIEADITI